MKCFYPISLLVVGLLALSPLVLLPGGERTCQRVVIGYDAEGEAIVKTDPVIRFESYGAAVKSIDPATCGDTTSGGIVQGYIYEGLYGYHFLKRPLEVVANLAAELPEISADGLTVTIRIRPGVKYARNRCFGADEKGRAKTRTVTARDFELTFKRCADANLNAGQSWAFLAGRIVGIDAYHEKTKSYGPGDFSRYDEPISGIGAVDELTLRIRLNNPFPQLLYVLAMTNYAPIPREAVDYWLAGEDDGAGGRRPIPPARRICEFTEAKQLPTTGPYILRTFQRKTRIVLVRNPDYRRVLYPSEGSESDRRGGLLDDAGRALPFVDVVQFDFTPEDYSAWMKFLYKRVDSSGIPRETFEDIITPSRELARKWAERHIRLLAYESPAIYWLAFNMEDAVLRASPSLRRGLCLGFDVDNYIRILHNGRGRRAVNTIPSSFKGHRQAGPGPYCRLDRAEAGRLLAQAKAELARAGLLADGAIPALQVDLGDPGEYGRRLGAFIRQQMTQMGLPVRIRLNDWPTLQQKVRSDQYQIHAMGWHADYPDAENFLQLYYSPNIEKGTNSTNYSNAAYDRLFEQARFMDETPRRTQLYAEMARMIGDDCPVLLLSEPLSYALTYEWVRNVNPAPIGHAAGMYRRIDVALRRKLGGPER